MNDNEIDELVAENERLLKQISFLKQTIDSLNSQLSEANSDLIVAAANKRGKP